MLDSLSRGQAIQLVRQAMRWRPGDRQISLAVLAMEIVSCGLAITATARPPILLAALIAIITVGSRGMRSRQQRHEREALAVRAATRSSDDVPADVIALVAAGKKIRAINRYRELTGVGLREAKVFIDAL